MHHQQTVSVSSTTARKYLRKLKHRLVVANQCLVAKDKIINGLRLDLDHLVGQIHKIKQYKDRSC